MYSRHNTSYWQGIPYLGCGPSAHSFDGDSREWNVASLNQYLSSIEQGQRQHETEQLDTQTRYNEYIITGLRTMWGISTEELKKKFGDRLWKYCLEQASSYLENGKFHLPNGLHSNGVLSSMAGCNCLIDTKTMENQESRSLNAGDKVGAILL